MPIRDIIVDWGVFASAGNNPGKYKNRKPKCDGSTFGDSSGACESAYYEFFGAYTFDAGNADNCNYTIAGRSPINFTDADRAQLTRRGLKPNDRYCAFKPKVIIIDNWGWCNGSCQQNVVQDGDHSVTYMGCWESDAAGNANSGRCTSGRHPDYTGENADHIKKVGTPFNGWVIVAEQK